MAEKLTRAQMDAVAAMPLRVTMWGGKPIGGLPKGVTMRAIEGAQAKGAVKVVGRARFATLWDATAKGRAALEDRNG